MIGVHLKGTFNMTRHACEYWSNESKAGRIRRAAIVNTVSSAGLQGNVGQANYGAAKAGIAALTTITALEGTRYGVRANAIAPGGATRMVNEAMPNIPVREANEVPDGEFERLNPGNSAPMVVWLASDESLLVSGQVFRAVGSEIAHYLPVAHRALGDQQGEGRGAEVGSGPHRHRAGQERVRPPARWPPAQPLSLGDAPASGGAR